MFNNTNGAGDGEVWDDLYGYDSRKPVKADSRSAYKPPKPSRSRFNFGFDDFLDNFRSPMSRQAVKRDEIVKPYISYWDGKNLSDMMKADRKETMTKNPTAPCGPDIQTPDFVVNDIYQMFNTPMRHVKFNDLNDDNNWQFQILDQVNHYYLRTITEHNALYSYIVTKELVKALDAALNQNANSPNQPQPAPGNGGGGQGGQPQSLGEKIQQLLKGMASGSDKRGAKTLQAEIEKAAEEIQKQITDAAQTMEDMKEFGDMEEGEGGGDGGGSGAAKNAPTNLEMIKKIMEFKALMSQLRVRPQQISSFITKTLKHSTKYFSSKFTEYEESILDTDEVGEITNVEDMAPIFRMANLEEITTPAKKFKMSFDVYIDISGSMDSNMSVDGKSIPAFHLARVTALKIAGMGFCKDIYVFNNTVHKITKKRLVHLKTSGGTSIDQVIKHVQQVKRPALVITDMDDRISLYSDNVFFLGINGASFRFDDDNTKKYLQNKQAMEYKNNAFSVVGKK